MAKKYKNVETKVSPVTIISIILFIAVLITLIVVLQPSAKTNLTTQYLNNGANTSIKDDYKFEKENHITPLNHLNDKWFGLGKGLLSEIKEDKVTIVFFGNSSDANSIGSIAYVEYYLYKEDSTKELAELVKEIYHFNTQAVVEGTESKNDITRIFESISSKLDYEEGDFTASSIPTLVAFKNGEVLHKVSGSQAALTAIQIKTFYNEVIKLINK